MDKSPFSSRTLNAHALKRVILKQHTPLTKVERTYRLAKHAVQTIAGALERAAVARVAECHLGLDYLDGALMQCEKMKKIGVCLWA